MPAAIKQSVKNAHARIRRLDNMVNEGGIVREGQVLRALKTIVTLLLSRRVRAEAPG